MANKISIVIQAEDNASKVVRSVGDNIEQAGKQSEASTRSMRSLNDHIGALAGVSAAAALGTRSLIGVMASTVDSANTLQAALTGLNSVATAFGTNADAAKRQAQELAADGLMTVADAATGLKNLLASGFSLNEATTLMKRFKDSAAFGRQSALSFGAAVASATEGIKNGNSILVDNAGVTKNLSVMLKEAGLSEQDLGLAASDAGVRQAIFSGILKETNAQAGDAARLADSAAGKQAVWAAQTEVLRQRIGEALQPALLKLLETVTPMVTTIATWIENNPELAAGILIVTTGLIGLATIVGTVALAVAGLAPVFALFQVGATAAIGGVSAAFTAFKVLAMTPFALPAIAVVAAIASIMAVKAAHDEMSRAIQGQEAANQASLKTTRDFMQRNLEVQASGVYSLETKARYQTAMDNINKIDQKKALGTNFASGGTTLVGEHGPELVNLPAGSQVSSAWKTVSQSASDGAGAASITINGNVILQTAAAVDAFFKQQDQAQRFARMGM